MKKIKDALIHKVKVKKQYAKLKAREKAEETGPRRSVYEREEHPSDNDGEPAEPVPEPSLEPHPDRVRMLENAAPENEPNQHTEQRQRRQRPQPYQKESEFARKKKEEADVRQAAREEAERERAVKVAERERFKKTMAKARGGPNGQRKLGRESTVLLAKAQRIMGKT